MSIDERLARQLQVLRDALGPLARRLEAFECAPCSRQEMARHSIAETASRHLTLIESAALQMEQAINGGLGPAVAGAAPDGDVHRAAGRLEAALDPLLDGYWLARSMAGAGPNTDVGSALVEVYADILGQVRDWLAQIDAFVRDPAAVIAASSRSATEPVEVTIALKLLAPTALLAVVAHVTAAVSRFDDDDDFCG